MITNDYSRNEKDYVTHNDYVDSDERKGWETKINNNINSEETDDDNRDNNLDKIVALTAWNTEELMLYKVINMTDWLVWDDDTNTLFNGKSKIHWYSLGKN